jgi:hypothetical protein
MSKEQTNGDNLHLLVRQMVAMMRGKMCERCGDHPYDEKCLDEYVGDELRPVRTGLAEMLNDERLPHAVRGKIVEAVNALGEAMQAAEDCTPNAGAVPRRGSDVGTSPLLGGNGGEL